MTTLTVEQLTTGALDGAGIFDALMRANKVHLDAEYTKDRIKGAEYATVYLGSLESVMNTALQFLLQKEKIGLEADMMALQVQLAQIEKETKEVQLEIVRASLAKVPAEIALLEQQVVNLRSEDDLTKAKTSQLGQQTQNMVIEGANLNKQGVILTNQAAQIAQQTENLSAENANIVAKTALTEQQKFNLTAEGLNIPKMGEKLDADVALSGQQKLNLVSDQELTVAKVTLTTQQATNLIEEGKNIPKQGLILDAQKGQITQQTTNLTADKLLTEGKTALTTQQTANSVIEGTVLQAQKCKLTAEYDLTMSTNLKVQSETGLLGQKIVTEKAQVLAVGVDENSVIGRQKGLYLAQTNGFQRDAEQKAAKIMVDTWNVRRTTDDVDTVASPTNKLDDTNVGKAVGKMLTGIGAY